MEVLEKVRGDLQRSGYEQIPQLSSLNPIDVNTKFDLLPDSSRGTKRAVMIGINYIGTFYNGEGYEQFYSSYNRLIFSFF